MPAEPTSPHADFVAQYRAIIDHLLDRGNELTRALKHATRPGPVAHPGPGIDDLATAFERITRAVCNSIRLDLCLDRARPGELPPILLARIVAAICRELDAAAALLPGAARPPPHADTAALCARANRLATRPLTAEILPLRPTPPRRDDP